MSSWGRIYRSLRDLVPDDSYRLGMALERIEQDEDGVTAIFADGTRERGDILIGSDGSRSTVREQMLPGLEPSYAGYVAWRAMLEESEIPPDMHRELFGALFLLPAAGRTLPCLSGARSRQRDRAGPARLQHRLVPADPSRRSRAAVHRRHRALPRHRHRPASDRPPGDRRHPRHGAAAARAAGRGDFRALPAAVLPGDLRSGVAATSPSAASRCSAMPPSSPARIPARAPPRPRSTP